MARLQQRCHVDVHLDKGTVRAALAEDVRRGLTSNPKYLLPKYFYDPVGSALFDQITRLPEYYLARAEQSIVAATGWSLLEKVRPADIVELGSGSCEKTRRLLDTASPGEWLRRYIPFDVDEEVVQATADTLSNMYPFLDVHGVVGDFERHLSHIPRPVGRRLVVFFGSTIGNLGPEARHHLLTEVRGLLAPGDRFLLGVDLVKDRAVLEAAYNDAQGVTAEFNRNILRVMNRTLGANFVQEEFQHRAFYNQEARRIEMHLVPERLQNVHIRDLGLRVRVEPGESIWTESSYKFSQESVKGMLARAGLQLERWCTDPDSLFALVTATPK